MSEWVWLVGATSVVLALGSIADSLRILARVALRREERAEWQAH